MVSINERYPSVHRKTFTSKIDIGNPRKQSTKPLSRYTGPTDGYGQTGQLQRKFPKRAESDV